MNPFIESYNTPFDVHPFDLIKEEHFEEAITEGIKFDREEIERIATNPSTPTFANTLAVPSENQILERTTNVLFNLCSAESNDNLEQIAQRVAPIITDHSNAMATDRRMFERVKYIKEHEYNSLETDQRTLTDKAYDGYIRHGIALPEKAQKRFCEIDREVSQLTLQFAQNNLKATNGYALHLTNESDLSGLPSSAIEAAARTAKERGLEGWIFTIHAPSYQPFINYCDNRELRRELYMARNTISTSGTKWDNTQIAKRIINLRREYAQLLGYSNFADFVLEKRMALNSEKVLEFLNNLLNAYLPKAKTEIAEVAELARKEQGSDFKMEPWDFSYYSQKLRKARYDLDTEMLRPYFELENVKRGVFGLATRLYGISFRKNPDIPVYHPEVEAFDVMDKDGSMLAVLYTDFHPRAGKKSGAWMTNFKEQYYTPDGENSRPHVSIVMNFTRPTDTKPALLTLSEVETFLHEFGHALHGMFSDVRYKSISGTNVSWDFVELPSQFMENYVTEPEFLKGFARHFETDEVIPDELINRVVRAKNFLCGYSCVRQLSFSLLDMAYYTLDHPFDGSIKFFEDQAWRVTQVLPWPKECCMTVQFQHIMSGGYSTGYYSYKWAEVLEADAFSVFQKEGIFNTETAERFRREILSKGAVEKPMILYHRFRGGEPSIDALLKRNGLK